MLLPSFVAQGFSTCKWWRLTFGGWRRGARHERSSAMLRPTTSPPPTLHHSLCAVYYGARRRRAEAPTTLLCAGVSVACLLTSFHSSYKSLHPLLVQLKRPRSLD